ncbi:hypothetical protein BgiBS90_011672 [Biomphalaria glabrata]|nr:hypothetical protein BgiBS90_011672 [Biomphalaria glabrata]
MQYVAARARSRSPSPCLSHGKEEQVTDEESGNSLQPESAAQRSRSRRRARTLSRSRAADIMIKLTDEEDPNASTRLLSRSLGGKKIKLEIFGLRGLNLDTVGQITFLS